MYFVGLHGHGTSVLAGVERRADAVHGGNPLDRAADALQRLGSHAGHDAQVRDDVGRVGDLHAELRERRPDRPHRERNDVHRAPAHAALEQAVEGRAHLGRGDPVVGRAGILFALAADEGAVLDAGDIVRVAAGEKAEGAVLGVEADERALLDEQLGDAVELRCAAVAPDDGIGLSEFGDPGDPVDDANVRACRALEEHRGARRRAWAPQPSLVSVGGCNVVVMSRLSVVCYSLRRELARVSKKVVVKTPILSIWFKNERPHDPRAAHPALPDRAGPHPRRTRVRRSGIAGSQLSLMENGKREPRLSLLNRIAETLGIQVSDLLAEEPPSVRAALEIGLDQLQQGSLYSSLGLPVASRVPQR